LSSAVTEEGIGAIQTFREHGEDDVAEATGVESGLHTDLIWANRVRYEQFVVAHVGERLRRSPRQHIERE
jgi:hypothetical protein